jgi:acyl-CoA thioesterase II
MCAINERMGDFAVDTAVTGSEGRYRATLSSDWDVWGPVGGYRAAICLRAMGAASRFQRAATFACHFLGTGRFGECDIEVTVLTAGKRAESLRATMLQDGKAILEAWAWLTAPDMRGFEHEMTAMPQVPRAEELKGFQDLADNYADWYPFWRHVEGRPVVWSEAKGPPIWHTWMRMLQNSQPHDPFVEAGRAVMWIDLVMWNAALPPHGYPPAYIAPNLDLTVQFHSGAPEAEWLLCDGHAPIATAGLVGGNGRVWSPDGRLLATGTSQLICRPNPFLQSE